MSVAAVVFLIFLIFKLLNLITWSWWWVFSPLWGPYGVLIVFYIITRILKKRVESRDKGRGEKQLLND